MSKARPTRRLNPRALAIVTATLVVAAGVAAGVWWFQNHNGRHALLAEAKARLGKNQTPLALGYLTRYLELVPEDTDALELKGKVLAESAQTETQAQEAANALNAVIGRDPSRMAARRLLVKSYLRVGELARAAETQARELIKRGGDDAEAHRLLARALERIGAADKSPDVLEEARKEYEAAETREPSDVEGAERLAALYRDLLDKPEPAGAVLDHLVGVTAKTPKAHAAALLARARHRNATRQPGKAEADIDQAVKDDPENVDARLAASEAAVAHRDTATARAHLKAIDPSHRDDLRVKIAEGLIDLAEQRPDDAIQTWRAGLVRAGGNDADLTFRLAYVLLQVGRVNEAEALVEQFRRLSGGETPVPSARHLKGLLLLKSNRPSEAIAEFEPIRYKIDKRLESDLFFSLGQAYELTRDAPKALESYQKSTESSREWSGPWLAVARLQAASNPAEAAATLRKGLANNPGEPRMLATLAQVVWRAQAAKPEKERSWDEVTKVLDEAKKAAPGAPEIALVEAEYLMNRRRPDDAIGLLDVATRLHPKSVELWLARANDLARAGKFAEALTVTEQAVTAAGPQAGFYNTRASLLSLKGEVGKARDAMVEGLGKVPREQKPLLWKTLGDFYHARKQDGDAKAAFTEWAKLEPENPDARVSLFELALASGGDDAIAGATEAVRKVSGPKAYYWKLARVEDLLRRRPRETPDKQRDDARIDEAAKLVAEIRVDQPQLPLGPLLEARVGEARKQTDQAVLAYEQALKLGGGQTALNRLVALLAREHRDADLERLRAALPSFPGPLNWLEAVTSLKAGGRGRAEQLAALAVRGDPQGLDVRVWRNEVFKDLGNPDEVEAAMKVLADQKPEEPAPWIQLLMLQLSRRQADKAAATIEEVRRQVKKVEFPELLWAACYRALGDVRRALECYREAQRRWPDDVGVLTSAITFYEQIGLRDDAEQALRSILRRDPSRGWATRGLAQSLAGRAGNASAWEEAIRLIGPDPMPNDVPDDTLTRAAVYARGPSPKHKEKALAIVLGLLAELPDLAVVQEKAARLLSDAGRLAEARDHSAKAVAVDRPTPDAILFHAGVLLALNDVAAAEAQLDRLTAIDPDALPVAELKSRILVAKGETREAADVLERAFNDRASTPEALGVGEAMVRLLMRMGRTEAAERVARKLAATQGPRGGCLLAEQLAGLGKLDDAAALLERVAQAGDPLGAGDTALTLATATRADPRWAGLAGRYLDEAAKARPPTVDLLQKQAIAQHFQHRYEQEIALYQKVRGMNPDNYQYMNNVAWTLSEDLNRPDQGRQWADEALKKAGDLANIRDTRGVILTRLGDYDAAIKDLEVAARDSPGASVYYHLARAFTKAKRPDDARKWRELASKAGLTRDQLQPSELADWDAVMAP